MRNIKFRERPTSPSQSLSNQKLFFNTMTTKVFDPIAQFNSGKGFKTIESGTPAEETVLPFYIQSAQLEVSKFKDGEGNDQYQMVVICGVDDPKGEISKEDLLTTIYQTIRFTETGEMKNPAYPEWVAKDGKVVLASQIYEVLEAAKEYDAEAYEAAKKKSVNKMGAIDWASRLKGLKFNFNAKLGDRKDGSGKYVILETTKQKAKDAVFFAKRSQPTMGSEADFEAATSPAKEVNTQTSMDTVADKNGKISVENLPF
jgi:hypothetical protein